MKRYNIEGGYDVKNDQTYIFETEDPDGKYVKYSDMEKMIDERIKRYLHKNIHINISDVEDVIEVSLSDYDIKTNTRIEFSSDYIMQK